MYKAKLIKKDSKRETTIEITGDTKDELFAAIFRKCFNRFKYCQDVSHFFVDTSLGFEYSQWISDINNYAKSGGDMW